MAADFDGWTLDRYHAARRFYHAARGDHFHRKNAARMTALLTRLRPPEAMWGQRDRDCTAPPTDEEVGAIYRRMEGEYPNRGSVRTIIEEFQRMRMAPAPEQAKTV